MIKKKNSKRLNSDSKVFAFIATFFSIFGFIVALVFKQSDEYVMFYAKQSIVLFVVTLVVSFIKGILLFVPILGMFMDILLSFIIVVFWVFSWIYALSGEVKEIPYIGVYAKNLRF